MKTFSEKENEVLIFLLKDINTEYNANSLSKELDLSPRGSLKILKNLEKAGLILGDNKGKARFYKINIVDIFTKKYLEVLLIQESREKANRWIAEFQELYKLTNLVIIFGSMVQDSKKAKDIDLLLMLDPKYKAKIDNYVKNKNKTALKPIHPVFQSKQDFISNIKKSDLVMLNILKTGIVLHGQDVILEAIKDLANK